MNMARSITSTTPIHHRSILHTGDRTVDLLRRRCLHRRRTVRVGVDRGSDRSMPEDFCKRFDINPIFQSHRRESVAQIVETNVLASGTLENLRQSLSAGGWLSRIFRIHR